NKGQRLSGKIVIAETRAKPFAIFSSIFSATLGTVAFSALTMFYFIRKTNPLEWVLLAAGTLALYWPTFLTDGVGLLLVAAVYLLQKARNKRDEARAAPAAA
ncbi:MAG: hypothetical protein P1P84_22295, partial [Deferrisomatales bacterium]|nr:hypothetical protein [Deferrisomatales bacterium]